MPLDLHPSTCARLRSGLDAEHVAAIPWPDDMDPATVTYVYHSVARGLVVCRDPEPEVPVLLPAALGEDIPLDGFTARVIAIRGAHLGQCDTLTQARFRAEHGLTTHDTPRVVVYTLAPLHTETP